MVALDGTGVQLGNNGGNLILQDDDRPPGRRRHLHRRGRASDDHYVRFRR